VKISQVRTLAVERIGNKRQGITAYFPAVASYKLYHSVQKTDASCQNLLAIPLSISQGDFNGPNRGFFSISRGPLTVAIKNDP
jgi:hypothetical protein